MKYLILVLFVGCFSLTQAQDTTVSKADIIGAAKLFDIQFTQKEMIGIVKTPMKKSIQLRFFSPKIDSQTSISRSCIMRHCFAYTKVH